MRLFRQDHRENLAYALGIAGVRALWSKLGLKLHDSHFDLCFQLFARGWQEDKRRWHDRC